MAKQKLTNIFCNSVTHSGTSKSHETYTDTELSGFSLEVRVSGSKTFNLRYQDNGRTRVHRIGNAAAMSAADARTEAKRIRSEIDLGRNLISEKSIKANTLTLQQFYDQHYLQHIKQHNRSWESQHSIFTNHLLPLWGGYPMPDITRLMIKQAHDATLAGGAKPATANKIPIYMSRAFNLALEWELTGITKNPAVRFGLFAENNQIDGSIDKAQTERLLKEADRSQNRSLGSILRFLLLTGARRNEALHAMWENFDFVAMIWTIPLSKSGKAHHVPITDALYTLLMSVPRVDGVAYVFPSKFGKPFANIFNAWNTARKRAGLPNVRLHDLRHTFASTLVNAGAPLYTVQKLLGHSTITMTQRYAHLNQESLVASAEIAASLLPAGDLLT